MPLSTATRHWAFGFLLIVTGCVEHYTPPVNDTALNLLVVDGFLNTDDSSVLVRLSHTQTINAKGPMAAELRSHVSITGSNGDTWMLMEGDSGKYALNGLIIDKSAKYTLHITTSGGDEYFSDPVEIKESPPIDSLSWRISNDQNSLEILVATHDPSMQSHNYLWTFTETYEYHAPIFSGMLYVNGGFISRPLDSVFYVCYKTRPSPTYTVGSTKQLASDVVTGQVVTSIQKGSLLLTARYSALVKQRVLSDAEYEFRDKLLKSTENLGSIFGTTPAAVVGNVYKLNGTDDASIVLGYFGGGTFIEKRMFINREDLPESFKLPVSNEGCVTGIACTKRNPDSYPGCGTSVADLAPTLFIGSPINDEHGNIIAVTYTDKTCADCRVKGGSLKPPDFW